MALNGELELLRDSGRCINLMKTIAYLPSSLPNGPMPLGYRR